MMIKVVLLPEQRDENQCIGFQRQYSLTLGLLFRPGKCSIRLDGLGGGNRQTRFHLRDDASSLGRDEWEWSYCQEVACERL